MLVLDQPSSQLDPQGEGALVNCLIDAKRRGLAVVVFSAKRSIFRIADKAMELRAGRIEPLDLEEIRRMGQAFRSAMVAPATPEPRATPAAATRLETAS